MGLPCCCCCCCFSAAAAAAAAAVLLLLLLQFAAWVKQNVMAGRPVITGVRVRGGGYPDYDHIM